MQQQGPAATNTSNTATSSSTSSSSPNNKDGGNGDAAQGEAQWPDLADATTGIETAPVVVAAAGTGAASKVCSIPRRAEPNSLEDGDLMGFCSNRRRRMDLLPRMLR